MASKSHRWTVRKIKTTFWRTRWITVCVDCNFTYGPFRTEQEARACMGGERMFELAVKAVTPCTESR